MPNFIIEHYKPVPDTLKETMAAAIAEIVDHHWKETPGAPKKAGKPLVHVAFTQINFYAINGIKSPPDDLLVKTFVNLKIIDIDHPELDKPHPEFVSFVSALLKDVKAEIAERLGTSPLNVRVSVNYLKPGLDFF